VREIPVATTGFVDISRPDRELEIRFLTPRREIAACGHVTIAAASALVEHGHWDATSDGFALVAPAGRFELRVSAQGDGGWVEMALPVESLEPPVDAEAVAARLGVALAIDMAPGVVFTGLRQLVLTARTLGDLETVRADRETLEAVGRDVGVDTIALLATSGSQVIARNFTAPTGDVEEPAGGTTAASIAHWLWRRTGRRRYDVRMGVHMGRPSRIVGEVRDEGRVVIGGRTMRRLKGHLEIE
jgi:PhzF family phenazine biosynthesis protein